MSDALVPPARILCSAPGRANLIGNPSDQYGGCTLACSVPLRAWVEIVPADRWALRCDDQEQVLDGSDALDRRGDRFDVARAVLEELAALPACPPGEAPMALPACPPGEAPMALPARPPGEVTAARVTFGSEIPRQSGMAGSTALLVALLRALLAWVRPGAAPAGHRLAEWAREIERGRLGVTCGYVDHYLSVFGGLRFADFSGKTPEGSAGDEPFATVEDLTTEVRTLPFVLGFTGIRHSSDSVHRPIRGRWLAGEPRVIAAYRRVAELGRLGRRALLQQDWEGLGRWMNENHAIQRSLGGSGAPDEALVTAALRAGAPGAKLAGAGHGGTVVALWPGADPEPLEAAWREVGVAAIHRPTPVPGVEIEEA